MAGVGSIHCVIPHWLQSVILGHGNPMDPTYQSETMKVYTTMGVPNPDANLDYGDTFIDETNLRPSFMDLPNVVVVNGRNERIKTSAVVETNSDDVNASLQRQYNNLLRVIESDNSNNLKVVVEAVSYETARRFSGVGNTIRFTPRQVAAIRSGKSPGLSLIVGPPRTGKTDVAVQIIACLYYSFQTQRNNNHYTLLMCLFWGVLYCIRPMNKDFLHIKSIK